MITACKRQNPGPIRDMNLERMERSFQLLQPPFLQFYKQHFIRKDISFNKRAPRKSR